jgi:hypothetical protein
MAIQTLPIISEPIYLQDLSERVAQFEANDPEEERAFVIIRQATEADNMRRGSMRSEVIVRWKQDGTSEEVRNTNLRELWAYEVYLTLCDAGNITNEKGDPLFTFITTGPYGKIRGGWETFQKVYGSLPSFVTDAIRAAVYKVNPDWNFAIVADEEGEV